jgi:hypothetical protein
VTVHWIKKRSSKVSQTLKGSPIESQGLVSNIGPNVKIDSNKVQILDYENRLTCFIDILGFKEAIKDSVDKEDLRAALYSIFADLQSEGVKDYLYGSIPVLLLEDGGPAAVSAREFHEGDHVAASSSAWPIEFTQFSDSFVISCPSDNSASCGLFLKAIYYIHLRFFWELGMLVRGGLSKGDLVHRDGVLFGPSMNEAYKNESEVAGHPRVIVPKNVEQHLNECMKGAPELLALKLADDGHTVFDIVSIFDYPPVLRGDELKGQLLAIEKDIQDNSPKAHPKIAYLLDQLRAN